MNLESSEDAFGINESSGVPERKFSINFRKVKTKFCLSLHYNHDNSYLIVSGKEICKFKFANKNSTFQINFV